MHTIDYYSLMIIDGPSTKMEYFCSLETARQRMRDLFYGRPGIPTLPESIHIDDTHFLISTSDSVRLCRNEEYCDFSISQLKFEDVPAGDTDARERYIVEYEEHNSVTGSVNGGLYFFHRRFNAVKMLRDFYGFEPGDSYYLNNTHYREVTDELVRIQMGALYERMSVGKLVLSDSLVINTKQ